MEEERKKNNILLVVFGIIMLCTYFGMAYLLVFSSLFVETFSQLVRTAMGVLFFAYGIFRAYRFFKTISYNENE